MVPLEALWMVPLEALWMVPLEAFWMVPLEVFWLVPLEALWMVPFGVLWMVPPVALWVHLPLALSKDSESLERLLILPFGASSRPLVGHRLRRVLVLYHDPGLHIQQDRPLQPSLNSQTL